MNDPYDLEAIPRPRGGNIARSKAATEKLRLMPDAPMSDKQAAMIDAEIAAAERRGEARILREIATLPSPWKPYSRAMSSCEWCAACAPRHLTHPNNGCLWPRAQQAAQAKE